MKNKAIHKAINKAVTWARSSNDNTIKAQADKAHLLSISSNYKEAFKVLHQIHLDELDMFKSEFDISLKEIESLIK